MPDLNQQKFIVAILAVLVIIAGLGYIISIDKESTKYTNTSVIEDKKNEEQSSEKLVEKENKANLNPVEKVKKDIVIHVTGAVKNPDTLVTLTFGSRVQDAIVAAGGATDDVDYTYINLAAPIDDGDKVYIPSKDEEYEDFKDLILDNIKIDAYNGLININTASKIELKTLKGVGDATADAIISYREKNGPFNDIEDIKKVKGIGEATFNDLKDKITT